MSGTLLIVSGITVVAGSVAVVAGYRVIEKHVFKLWALANVVNDQRVAGGGRFLLADMPISPV